MAIRFSPSLPGYVDMETGKEVPLSRIMDDVDRSRESSKAAMKRLMARAVNETVSLENFGIKSKQEIKEEFIRLYILGRGGRDMMTQADWGRLGAMIKKQYKFLDGFIDEMALAIAAGTAAKLLKRWQARLAMYSAAARQAWEMGREITHVLAGFKEEAWNISIIAEHCDDCISFFLDGWQPIGTFPSPGDGNTQCLSNCKCYKEYRK